jgi:hypothetical protein
MLVHRVTSAATAQSLQRYLKGLGQVEAVEPREFAQGMLRLELTTREPVTAAELLGWPEGAGHETVTARPDLLEIRLRERVASSQ